MANTRARKDEGLDASFGSVLSRLRGRRGLTQEELAERSGLSVYAISTLERGIRPPPHATMIELLAGAMRLEPRERAELAGAAPTRVSRSRRREDFAPDRRTTVPRRVFLSHTSDLRKRPPGRSFVAAAEAAVLRAGHALSDMAYFAARDSKPADYCVAKVSEAHVYVGIIGRQYGTRVRERPDCSYVELEFETASALGLMRLVFLVLEDADQPPPDEPAEHSDRQASFRRRLQEAGLTVAWITSPEDLEVGLLHALDELDQQADGRSLPPDAMAGVPPDPTPHFVGRAAELAEVGRALREHRQLTIHGLGGVGKSQLAARFLKRHRQRYPDGTFWLRADEASNFVDDMASLAWHLGLPERWEPNLEHQLHAVLRWLRQFRRWIVVVDDLDASGEATAQRWLPPGMPGHVLTTSRAAVGPVRLALGPLPADVATTFVIQRTGQADLEAARSIVDALCGLPLAIEQAASYIEASSRDMASYVELLRTRLLQLMEEGRSETYPWTVATTWRLSFERVECEHAAAADLLKLCAFLAPEDVPLGILREAADQLPERLSRAVSDDIELDRTVAALRRYSFVNRHGDVLSVHRLVQVVVRASLDASARTAWLGTAVRVLRASFPDTALERPDQWALCGRLVSHVQTVERLAVDPDTEPLAMAWLLDRVGAYLDGRAEFGRARPLLERALAIRQHLLGDQHPDSAETLDNLAGLLTHIGDLAGARPLYDRALAIRERTMGADDPQTASSLNNLAVLLHRQGDLVAARSLYERALSIDERMLGPSHPHTAKDLNNLARLLRELRQPAAARTLLERALAISERTVGPHDPLTATSLNNLAQLHRAEQRPEAARPLLERSLRIYERVLGEEHPYTTVALSNLSGALREQGELNAARRLAERALQVQERVLGPDHPDLAVGLVGLALVLQSQGEPDGAEPLLRRALALRDRAPVRHDVLATVARQAMDEISRAR